MPYVVLAALLRTPYVVAVTIPARRRGPVPRFSREQLVDAAVGIVETQGFAALSLRSVARQLGVGPMTLYTYVESSNQLASLVVDRLIDDALRGMRWPSDWRGVLRLVARRLDALLSAHPAMVEAYQRDMLRSGRATQVASDVVGRLAADGLTGRQAKEAWYAVQAMVVGFAVMRSGRPEGAGDVPLDSALVARLVGTLLDALAPA